MSVKRPWIILRRVFVLLHCLFSKIVLQENITKVYHMGKVEVSARNQTFREEKFSRAFPTTATR